MEESKEVNNSTNEEIINPEELANLNGVNQEELEGILESIPEDKKKVVERMLIASSVQMRSIVPPETKVMDKITSEHITEYLSASKEDMQKSYEDKKNERFFYSLIFIAVLVFFIIVIYLLRENNSDIMEKIIFTLGGILAGSIGGYGIGRSKSS